MKDTVRLFANFGGVFALTTLGACLNYSGSPSSDEEINRFTQIENSDAGEGRKAKSEEGKAISCLLYTSPSPRDATLSRMPSSA